MAFAAPLANAPRRLLISLVQGYRLLLKSWIGNVCRFEPSCSSYALQALEQHGAARGVVLTGGRILRCHPWCAGGDDPVPHAFEFSGRGLFTHLLSREGRAPVAAPLQPRNFHD